MLKRTAPCRSWQGRFSMEITAMGAIRERYDFTQKSLSRERDADSSCAFQPLMRICIAISPQLLRRGCG